MARMETPLETERPSPRYSGIDLWSPAEILDSMIEGQFAAVAAVHAARPALERAAVAIEERLRAGGRLVYAGAGTSGRLAVQDGAELMPTFSWPAKRLLLLMAGGDDALLRAVEGAEDTADEAAALIYQHRIGDKDALIAVAASGTTPFTLACLREAGARGALTVGIANNPDTPLLNEADHPVCLDTGAEPIAGSTRMKAGTAQRVALTLLSSLVMIRLGRVYEGLMVDVQPSNRKLVRRSEAILGQLTGHSREHVRDALRQAKGSVKLALLLLEGQSLGQAQGPRAENASAARHHNHAAAAPRSHGMTAQKAPQKKAPAIDQNVLQAEVLLDRAGFSPGTIDGRDGDNFAKALHAFQQVNGLPVGPLDQATLDRLTQVGGGPVVGEYTIQPQDVAGPFVPQIPRQFDEMAQLPQLAYHS